MGRLFHMKNGYSDEELESEEFENDIDDEDDSADEEDSEDDEDESEDDEEDSEDDEDESEDDEEDSEDEEDRRVYRKRRRIRNQVIAYSIVFALLVLVAAGGIIAGKSLWSIVKERRIAEEQARLREELQAQQEAEAAHGVVIDAPETFSDEPEEDYLGELVDSYISEMPLEDKVAGLFIVTPEALTGVSTAIQAGEGTQTALNEYAVGGLVYFDKNIVDAEQLTDMLSSTVSKSKYPLFLAVDEEGGSVSRVANSSIEVVRVGDMAAIGETGDTAQAYEAGLTIGAYLKDLGFNLDFAPVADLAGLDGGELGDRIFGSDAELVSGMVANEVDGIEGTGISSCLKHFPGIGYVEGDTHDGRVETTKTLDEMRNSDFIPFKAGIDAGADFVMVSHVTVSAIEEDAVPSTLSRTIMTDVLRNELGFQGVIITDALDMGAITKYYTSGEAAVQAIAAGADVLLMPEDFYEAYDAVLTAVQEGTISEERLNESLERIYRVKCAGKLE